MVDVCADKDWFWRGLGGGDDKPICEWNDKFDDGLSSFLVQMTKGL